MPRIHKIPGMVAHVCNPRAPTAKGEGWGAGEFQEAHQPASSAYTLPKKRPHLKQSGRQGPTPKAVIWIPHICCGMHTPTFSNTNIHATHTEKVRKKKKKRQTESSVHSSAGQTWKKALSPGFEFHCWSTCNNKASWDLQFCHVPLKKRRQGEATTRLYMPVPQTDKWNVTKPLKNVHL